MATNSDARDSWVMANPISPILRGKWQACSTTPIMRDGKRLTSGTETRAQ